MVHSIDVDEKGIKGKLFFPNSSEPCPAIIVLSGSDGGIHGPQAELFAKKGYVALALPYFNYEGLPKNLENIPLEYFLNSIRWLKLLPQVQTVHLHGISRGAELAVLLAAIFPNEIASVVAVAPSCVTYGGIPNEKVSTWTLGNTPFPIAPTPTKEEVLEQLKVRKTVDLTKIFLDKMQNSLLFEKACILVENIQCPLLLISGKDDRMWPSSVYSALIMKRLEEKGSLIFREHLCYDKVGHMILNPYAPIITEAFQHPITGLWYEVGGDSKAQAAACKDSWEKIIRFLSSF